MKIVRFPHRTFSYKNRTFSYFYRPFWKESYVLSIVRFGSKIVRFGSQNRTFWSRSYVLVFPPHFRWYQSTQSTIHVRYQINDFIKKYSFLKHRLIPRTVSLYQEVPSATASKSLIVSASISSSQPILQKITNEIRRIFYEIRLWD